MATTFNDILYKFRSESFTQKDKGTQFERLMRSWLLSDPRYSNLTDVWLWEDFPCRKDFGGKDTGIDLVARTDTGQYWAIQCKCYSENAVIDKPGVDFNVTLSANSQSEKGGEFGISIIRVGASAGDDSPQQPCKINSPCVFPISIKSNQ